MIHICCDNFHYEKYFAIGYFCLNLIAYFEHVNELSWTETLLMFPMLHGVYISIDNSSELEPDLTQQIKIFKDNE